MTIAFSYDSPVYFDELDANGVLHNTRIPMHVERAQSAWFETAGHAWTDLAARDADLHYAVRELHVEYLAPVTSPGPLRIDLTVDHLGTTSARYGFVCRRGTVAHARGHRIVVKTDRGTGRPVPWTDRYRRIVTGAAS
jgi:acyl-CoA thioester hydrolase